MSEGWAMPPVEREALEDVLKDAPGRTGPFPVHEYVARVLADKYVIVPRPDWKA